MTRIIKPRTLGCMTRTQYRVGGSHLIISAFGLFDVSRPGIFLADQALWPALIQELPEGVAFDTGMPKPCGEFVVAGRVKAEHGVPVPAMTVRVALGPLSKTIAVFGDRYWEPTFTGYMASAPKPFTEMKIDLRRSFGGPGHPVNSVGLGYHASQTVTSEQLCFLPNFENPQHLILSRDDTPEPFCLGLVDPLRQEMQKLAGTFDQTWQEQIAPALPLDADPRIYCVSPEDQRNQGFFSGNEALSVMGMTPEPGGYRGHLPGLRVRAFVNITSEPAGLHEVDLQLDTVLLLGSLAKGVVVFRGAVPVRDIDAKDAETVLLAYERMDEEPKPREHYSDVFRLRTDKQHAIKYVFAESQLTPRVPEDELQRRQKAREDYTRSVEKRFAEGADLVTRKQFALAGISPMLLPKPTEPTRLPVLLPSPKDLASGDLDFADMLDTLDKETAKVQQTLDALKAASEQAATEGGSIDLSKVIAALDENFDLDLAKSVNQGLADTSALLPDFDGLLAKLSKQGQPADQNISDVLEQTRQVLAGGPLPIPQLPHDEEAFQAAKAKFLKSPDAGFMGRIRHSLDELAAAQRPLPNGTDAKPQSPTSNFKGSLENATAKGGEALKGQLSQAEQDLQNLFPALHGQEGSALQALLETLAPQAPEPYSPERLTASLKDVRDQVDASQTFFDDGMIQLRRMSVEPTFPEPALSPAAARRFGEFIIAQWREGLNLDQRDMAGADLSGMDLSGTDLSGALLERANLTGTILTGSNCADAVFTAATLSHACLDNCNLSNANLSRAIADATSFRNSNLKSARAIESNFVNADFSGAIFFETPFMMVNLSAAQLIGAKLNGVTFMRCTMDHIIADECQMERCQFLECSAANLRFAGGVLKRSAMLMLKAPKADFRKAKLDGSSFAAGAEMPGSSFDAASLVGATLMKADLTGSSFVGARLDQAVIGEAKLKDCNFAWASLRRAHLSESDFSSSNMFAANLFEAQFRRAILKGVTLRSANLYSTNLSDAELTGADLTDALLDKSHLTLETSDET